MRPSRRWRVFGVVVLLTLACGVAAAQVAPGDMPRGLLQAYQASRLPAVNAFNQYAGRLFNALALIEMAWAAVLLALERSDLQSWMAGFLRKFLVLFAFLYLLQNGPDFADRIINSFTDIGAQVANMPAGASPGDIFFEGVFIAGTLLVKTDWTGFLLNPAPALMVILSALIIFVSFVVIVIHYIMAQVERYIVVSAGLIFLAFGGSSVTRPYVERFFALAVAVGVKLMVLFMVIGVGRVLTFNWGPVVSNISLDVFPVMTVLELIGGSLIYAAVAWGVPKFAASLLGGSPAFTGGDMISMGWAGAQAALVTAGGIGLAMRGAAALGAAGAASGGSGGIASAVSAGGGAGPAGPTGRGGPSGPGGPNGSSGPNGGSGGSGAPYSPPQPAPPSAGPSGTGPGGPSAAGQTQQPVDSAPAPPAATATTGSAPRRAPNQVPPPGWPRTMDQSGRKVFGAVTKEQIAFFASRLMPPDHPGGGSPPQMNMHGE